MRIDIQAGGSSRGIADLRAGTTDLGMVSRDLASDEAQLHVLPIARDGIGLIVHRDNPLSSLSRGEIIAIYRGGVRNWRDLGGPDAQIVVLNKAAGRATLQVFRSHFDLTSSEIRADLVIGHNQQGIKTIAANRHAIGYVSIGAAALEIARGVPIRLLRLDGVDATADHVANGSFPISRPLSLISRDAPQGLTKAFIEYCQSEAVHDLIRSQHLVPYAG